MDSRIATNFHTYMYHIYITITMFSSQQTGRLIGIGILAQTYICEQCHFIAYMKVSKKKLFMLRMIEFLLLLSSLQ